MKDYNSESLKIHRKLSGKINIDLKAKINNLDDLSIYYTPGVGAVSNYLHRNPEKTNKYTWINNLIAVISDGSAVLGLGNIGPKAALPVMEGKTMLFKQLAGIDAIPLVLDVHQPKKIVEVIKAVAPSFGGINLEDIAAPTCFEVEEILKKELSIPIMHDDQHGTAIVTLAGLINATKLRKISMDQSKIVIVGTGAAGTAIIKLIHLYAPKASIVAVDSSGIISKSRSDLNKYKKKLLKITNLNNQDGLLEDALKEADIFIGVSKPKLLNESLIKSMNKNPIIFAMANPEPEIYPNLAIKAGAFIVASGRSDFKNQVNNALAFPGIFRGALDNKVNQITDEHKIAAAIQIAKLVKKPSQDQIVPSIFNKDLVKNIAKVIT